MSKTYEQIHKEFEELNRFYKEPDGLGRGQDQFHELGIFDWMARLASGTSIEGVKASIRTYDEYKRKHPGEVPVDPR